MQGGFWLCSERQYLQTRVELAQLLLQAGGRKSGQVLRLCP